MPYWSSRALVLRTVEYSETSLIVHLLTRERGRTGAIAKGARRRESRFAGEIEVATLAEVVLFEGKDPLKLKTLSEIAITDSLRGARRSLERIYATTYAVELLREATPEGEALPEVYDLAAHFLARFAGPEPLEGTTVIAFEARLLELLGLFPSLDACVECGEEAGLAVAGAGPRGFSARLGGVICATCRPKKDRQAKDATTGALQALDVLGRKPERGTRLRLPAGQRAELRGLLDAYISHVLERELRTARYVGAV